MIKSVVFALAAMVSAVPATAAVVFSEDFNNVGFEGTFASNDTSDRFGATTYYNAANYNGWVFTGSTPYYARSTSAADGALMLNEPTGAATHTISGLTVGATYVISLLLSGDNIPGVAYAFQATMNGSNVIATTGVDGSSGSNPGSILTGNFVATASSMTLGLSQAGSPSNASPVVDNISIASVPEPATWAMMIGGFGLIGSGLRRRRGAARLAELA